MDADLGCGMSGRVGWPSQVQQLRNSVQQPLDWAAGWKMQFNPVLVLHDFHRQLEQL